MRFTAAAIAVFLAGVLHVLGQSPEEKLLDQLIDKRKLAEATSTLPPRPALDGKSKLYGPADTARAAATDTAMLAGVLVPAELYAIRYLSLANIPHGQRKITFNRISFLINSLSRKKNLTIPALIGPDDIGVRINLRDYGISPVEWDKMGDVDPYFHEWQVESLVKVKTATITKKVIRVWPGGIVPDGTYWPPGTQYYDDETAIKQSQTKIRSKARIGFASWLDPKDSAFLLTTVQTGTPILRGDWFLANASLPPFYHNLLGLKTLNDVKELAFFDERAERDLQYRATVVFSGKQAKKVARNNRILKRINTATGAWWQTLDFKTSIDKNNVITNFLTETFDGSEIIFTLPNGLQGYFLVNGKNERVDEVPIDIAVDYLAEDARVRNGRSCMWCHSLGIQPFRSDFKLTVGHSSAIAAGVHNRPVDLGINDRNDPEKSADLSRKIREVFEDPDFAAIVKIDNIRYSNAVKAVTGSSTSANAALFLQLYDEYAELPIDAERLVYEAGVSDFDVQAACKVKIDGVNDGVLIRRLLELPIRRDHLEEHAAEFMRRVVAWQAVRRATIKVNP